MSLPARILRNPASIALVGASRMPGKIGNVVLHKLLAGPADVHPVNPRADEIDGLTCYPSLRELPHPVEVAIIAIPARHVPPVIQEAVDSGVPLVMILSGGFAEVGEEGSRLQSEIRHIIENSGTRVIGPNTLGVIFPSVNYDTTFVSLEHGHGPAAGHIGLVSQSGSTAISILDSATIHDIGFSAFIGLGNRVDVSEAELIEFFEQDEETRAIALYLESISEGPRLLEALRSAALSKPVVVVKGGRSAAGSRAASLHTGSLAGSDRVVAGALRQVGAHRAFDEEELVDYARVLSMAKPLQGNRVAVIGAAGGHGVLLSDYIESTQPGIGLEMARLSDKTMDGLREVAVPFASVHNPIDFTGDVTVEMYDRAFELLQTEPGVDALVVSAQLQPPYMHEGIVDIVARYATSDCKPVVVSSTGGNQAQRLIAAFQRQGVAAFPSLWRTVRALGVLHERAQYVKRLAGETR